LKSEQILPIFKSWLVEYAYMYNTEMINLICDLLQQMPINQQEIESSGITVILRQIGEFIPQKDTTNPCTKLLDSWMESELIPNIKVYSAPPSPVDHKRKREEDILYLIEKYKRPNRSVVIDESTFKQYVTTNYAVELLQHYAVTKFYHYPTYTTHFKNNEYTVICEIKESPYPAQEVTDKDAKVARKLCAYIMLDILIHIMGQRIYITEKMAAVAEQRAASDIKREPTFSSSHSSPIK
jgi:pterin-4a-carbinolamine dehydratase